eukprot:14517771-Heterocapsa_arctica.AAC.1
MRAWLSQVRIISANKHINKLARKEKKEHTARLEIEICEMWRDRKMAPAWRQVRLAARVKKGAKRKWGNCPISRQPTLSQTMNV